MRATLSIHESRAAEADRDHVIEQLFAAEYTRLLRLATLVLNDRAAAEDAVQEAFVNLHRSWDRIRDLDAAPAYLRSIVMNTSRSGLRRLRVAAKQGLPEATTARSAEDGSMQRDDARRMVAILQTLPLRQRQCVALRYYADLSEREIAETLGISVGSVKSHTSRGMSALAVALENER
jgi:RNA polymerase sigma-70 factor (sigma-E family)